MSESSTAAPAATIVWFEVPSNETDAAKEFYGGLFGWSFQPFAQSDYHMTYEGGGAVYGDPSAKELTAYFGVADIDATVRRVVELGGTAGEKQEIPGVGFYAKCADPSGVKFGLYQGAAS